MAIAKQLLRTQMLDRAIASGATSANAVTVAKQFEAYVQGDEEEKK